MKKILSVAVILVIVLSGCASIVSQSRYPVTVSSDPDGARVTVRNSSGVIVFSGTTPSTVSLAAGAGFFRSETYSVTIEEDGYTSSVTQIGTSLDGWYIGNIIFGGLIGFLIVDPATGAMWTIEDQQVFLSLAQQAAGSGDSELHILSLADVPDEHLEHIVLID